MPLKDLLSRIMQIAAPPVYVADQQKRRVSTIYYLFALFLLALIILLIPTINKGLVFASRGILVAVAITLIGLILTRLGYVNITSYVVPLSLLAVNTYIIYYGQGIHDAAVIGMATIIALGGLLLGKYGAPIFALLCTLCLSGIYWADKHGLTGAGEVAALSDPTDLMAMGILLGIMAGLIYFIMRNFSRSIEDSQRSEQALRAANEELERNAAILEKRTEQLLTGAKVSRVATSILEPDELGQQVVDMVGSRFGLYYVSLFLLDDTGEWAVLHAGAGEAGKEMLKHRHRLKVGNTSMIGWCIANQKARIALDVGNEAVRFDNPMLPSTRSELALPLVSRGEVIGALGIQSDKEAAFTEEDIAVFQTMADQLANAIRNAQFYRQLKRELAERKRVEKEIRKLNAELEKRVAERTSELQAANEHLITLSRLKDDFVANVSHELRTPITSIMLYHSMLEKRPKEAEKYIRHLKRETDRLAHLIEDLLYLSRLDQGRSIFNPIPMDLNQLATDYISDREPLAHQRNIILEIRTGANYLPVQVDEQMIGQVLSIILTNAMNYTPPGGKITIRTHSEQKDGRNWAGFSIHDTGPGITPEDRERLFERFFRGKAGRESATPGTGLGLAIAREIVDRHAGRIEVESTCIIGEGTTFFVWLPAFTPPE